MRIYRLRIVAAALLVASVASFPFENDVSAATRRTTTKPKKKPTKRKPTTTKPVSTIAPTPTTLVPGPSELDVRNSAIKDVYERYKALIVKVEENKTTFPIVPIEGKSILTGEGYLDIVEFERRYLASGLYFVNVSVESLDFRIVSSSATSAVVRVCERIQDKGARRKTDDSVALNPVPVVVNDRQYDLVYSSDEGRWFIALGGRFNEEEDKSKCADGR
jgi:hypothetical protein